MQIKRAVPVFRIFDDKKAREFYVDWLGFKVDWEHRFGDNFPLYMQVSRGELILHLSEHHGDCCPGSKVLVTVEGAQKFHDELAAKDYRYNKPGFNESENGFTVIDPFHNQIAFEEEKI